MKDLKNTEAPSNTTTIDKNLIDAPTNNIYEAISIISMRAVQINENIKKELLEKLDEFAFNFDRKESNLDYYNSADLANVAGDQIQIIEGTTAVDITQLIGERSRGIVLWRWFIIAVLIFLIIEALLLRFWKV